MSPTVGVLDAIDDRRFATPGVARYLNALELDAVTDLLGLPREVKRYHQPAAGVRLDGTVGPLWQPGDGRPWLANDDVAAMQALGRCVADKLRERLAISQRDGAIHPSACGFCDLVADQLPEALTALAWAAWTSRYVTEHIRVWDGSDGAWYARTVASGYYENPRWSTFFGDQDNEQRAAAVAAAAGREQTA